MCVQSIIHCRLGYHFRNGTKRFFISNVYDWIPIKSFQIKYFHLTRRRKIKLINAWCGRIDFSLNRFNWYNWLIWMSLISHANAIKRTFYTKPLQSVWLNMINDELMNLWKCMQMLFVWCYICQCVKYVNKF